MSSEYNKYSPYRTTTQTWYLDYWNPITLVSSTTDKTYIIPSAYNLKPWLLAKELYGAERLYWVFSILNPDLLVDPVYDFKVGTKIQIPTNERIQSLIGGA
jgi:hypothetical protein